MSIIKTNRDIVTWGFTLAMGVAGVLHLVLGLGYIKEGPPDWAPKAKWFLAHVTTYTGLVIDIHNLAIFTGVCKILGVLALHGLFGGAIDILANLCFMFMFALVVPVHMNVKKAHDPYGLIPIACILFGVLRLCLPKKPPKKKKN